MIKTIARVEFLQMVRDGRFHFCALALALLLATSLAAGWSYSSRIRTEREIAQKDAREVWLAQRDKNPHSAAHFGSYAYKPLMPLALIDPGADAYSGTSVYLEAHRQNDDAFPPAQERPSLQRLGELTAAAVLQTILPLVIIVLTFGSLSGEAESGTLKQALSLGVSARKLVLGKASGILCALGLLVVPALLAGTAALWMFRNVEAPASAGRIGWMNFAYLLYLGGFVGLALAVSAMASSSRAALMLLTGYWAANLLMAPRIASEAAEMLAPTVSAAEFRHGIEEDMKLGIDGHNPQDKRAAELRARILKQYGVTKVEDLPLNFSGIALQASEDYSNQVYDHHFNDRWNAWERQTMLQSAAGFIAPVVAVRSVSMAMAGTDAGHQRQFLAAAEAHRRVMVRTLNHYLAYQVKPGTPAVAGRELWSSIPEFHYQAPGTEWAFGRQGLAFAALGFWFLGGAGTAMWAATRMKVVRGV